jgi:site-specific DNA recombinase
MKKRVFIYLRVSTAEQAEEGYSLSEQEERLRLYCQAMGWVLVKVYTDGGFSGANMERPALQEMIKAIEKGEADVVLVDKLDRMSRSQFDTLYLINKVFTPNNVAFVSKNESFDTSTPFGRAMVGILSVFAELERERLRERTADGREGRAKEGKWKGGSVPTGYSYDKATGFLEINKYEAEQVKMVYEMFNARTPIYTIMRRMNNKGYKAQNVEWKEAKIRHIVGSRVYLGEMKFKGEWVEAGHPAIIAEETWERAQVILKEREKANEKYRPGRMYSSPLAGLIRCANCGAKYHCKTSGKNKDGRTRRYYMCYSKSKADRDLVIDPNCKNKSYRDNALEEIIYTEIRKLKSEPLYIEQLRDSVDHKAILEAAEKRVVVIESQLSKLMDLYALDAMDINTVKAKAQKLSEEKKQLENEIEEHKILAMSKANNQEVVELVDLFEEAIKSGDNAQVNNIIADLIEYIIIDNEFIKIHWNF